MSSSAPAGRPSAPGSMVNGHSTLRHGESGSSSATTSLSPSSNTKPIPISRGTKRNTSATNTNNGRGPGLHLRRSATSGEPLPQLSERDSIFAEHYVSPPNKPFTSLDSPRSFPSSHAPRKVPSSMSTMVTHPVAPPETDKTSRAHSPRKLDWIRRSESFTDVDIPSASTRFSSGSGYGVRRIASDSNPWANKFNVVGGNAEAHSSESKRHTLHGEAMSSSRTYSERDSTQQTAFERGESMRAFMKGPRTERSVSRGRQHV